MSSPASLDQEPEIKPPMNEQERRATFIEHLEELRSRIFRGLVYITLGWIIGFIIEPAFYRFMIQPLFDALPVDKDRFKIVFTNVTQAFFLKFKISLILGLFIAFPLIIREIWGFIAPGLTPNERKSLRFIAPFSTFLFILGIGLAYYILPAAFGWFLSFLDDYPDAHLFQNPADYIMFVVKMMLAFGIGFQMPIVLMFLAKVGIATPEAMWKYARQAAVGIMLFAALLTPSGDAISMMAIGLPMIMLYFVSIFLVSGIARNKRKQQNAEQKKSDEP